MMPRKRRTTLQISGSPTRTPIERIAKRHAEGEARPINNLNSLHIDDVDLGGDSRDPYADYVKNLKIDREYIAVLNEDQLSMGFPDHADGIIFKGRQLRYQAVTIERSEDCLIGNCTCDPSRNSTIKTLGDSRWLHSSTLLLSECCHLRAARDMGYVEEWQSEREENDIIVDTVNDCHLFLDKPRLVIVKCLTQSYGVGIVLLSKTKRTCLVCHKESCSHVKRVESEQQREEFFVEEEEEEESGRVVNRLIESTNDKIDCCSHGAMLVYMSEEKWIVDSRGKGDTLVTRVGKNQCCSIVITPNPTLFISEKYGIDLEFIELYSSLFSCAGLSLYGYYTSRMDFARSRGIPTDKMITRSSLQKGWRLYLDQLQIDQTSFICPLCGIFPKTIVCDGICLGSRADIGASLPIRGDSIIKTINPGWLGNKRLRAQIREYSKGFGGIPMDTPSAYLPFLESASLPDGTCNSSYSDIIFLLFADSPIPDILKIGMGGESREVMQRLLSGVHDISNLAHEDQLIRFFPLLYKSMQSLWIDGKLPPELIQFLNHLCFVHDQVFKRPLHPAHCYGPIENSSLDYYPSWPKLRGLAKYDKDRRRDEMLCSRKDIVNHSTLSPGVLLLCCPHRVTYGFSVLDSSESPRSVFRVLSTRFPPAKMPEIVVYDNACHLSAYCSSREPALFKNTSFFIDRLHSKNHKTCSHSLYLSEYDADPYMKSLNSQSAEQTNALLRHVNHVLPFLKLPRFTKSLALFISKNQNSK